MPTIQNRRKMGPLQLAASFISQAPDRNPGCRARARPSNHRAKGRFTPRKLLFLDLFLWDCRLYDIGTYRDFGAHYVLVLATGRTNSYSLSCGATKAATCRILVSAFATGIIPATTRSIRPTR